MSGVTLAMHHRLQWFMHIRAQGLRKADEHSPPKLLMGYGTLYLFIYGEDVRDGNLRVSGVRGRGKYPTFQRRKVSVLSFIVDQCCWSRKLLSTCLQRYAVQSVARKT